MVPPPLAPRLRRFCNEAKLYRTGRTELLEGTLFAVRQREARGVPTYGTAGAVSRSEDTVREYSRPMSHATSVMVALRTTTSQMI